ncbi:amidase domain-containing protein [Paenibacillus sp. L3-i20]|uniref:amidase domain-containing protein n=1 Tax=Paenibacillus sp. L3-i20 TaxID=2905833 RepID=UPI001EDE0226|nr:amidase domain-containing protein [Paenibacillus sp. L3-i20]GKU80588.1 hypothetical protein L3i20_v249850 [Paenibacillus sp. L3-i20]
MSKSGSRVTYNQRAKRKTNSTKSGHSSSAASSKRQSKSSTAVIQRKKQEDIHVESEQPTQQRKQELSRLLQSFDSPRQASSTKEKSWKSALERYVNLYNQAETEQHARVLTDFVADRIHQERLCNRLDRIRDRDLLRGALPAGSETKAELIRVNESTHEISVLLRLHIKRRMEQFGRFYMEERYEYERLWLSLSNGQWEVLQVEPIIAERRPRYGASVHQWGEEEGPSDFDIAPIAPSSPFLNYDLMPQFKNKTRGIRYRRDLVAAFADRWWNEGNPSYETFEDNCTNYVSQCIFAGGAPMNYTGKRGSGWWYKGRTNGGEWWSYSWSVSNALSLYLSAARKTGLQAVNVQSANELQLGDVITYDWNGDGRYQHSTIVTAFDSAGEPLVNANTVASRHRYWDYRDSYAWTKGTKYRFFHIPNLL